MKLIHPEIETVFDTAQDKVNTLVIENQCLLYRLLTDIHRQTEGEDGSTVLSENGKILDMGKSAEVLDVFVPFDINRKTLLSRITAALEKNAMAPDHYEATLALLSDIEKYLYDIAFDFPCDLLFSKLSLSNLLKGAGVELRDDAPTLPEKIIDYMELVREFDRDKLFITLNLRCFITDEAASLLMETVLSHGFHLLMIETADRPRLPLEKRVVIDSDLCEIS